MTSKFDNLEPRMVEQLHNACLWKVTRSSILPLGGASLPCFVPAPSDRYARALCVVVLDMYKVQTAKRMCPGLGLPSRHNQASHEGRCLILIGLT